MFYGLDKAGKERFRQAMATIKSLWGQVFHADNLIAIDRCMSFSQDKAFMEAFEKHVESPQDDSIIWRLHTLAWAAKHCANIPGDFVECGVYKGFSSAVLTDYLDFSKLDKRFYLYDTYEGVPEDCMENSPSQPGAFTDAGLYETVRSRFSRFDNVEVVQGKVPDAFDKVCPEQIAFLHIDMNSAKAEIDALEVLWDRVSPGGILVLDDFGWFTYRAQTIAEMAFMKERGYTIMESPTGQGVVIKR
jgi:hypothetical protein